MGTKLEYSLPKFDIPREFSEPKYEEDGSYTQFGAQCEVFSKIHKIPNHSDINSVAKIIAAHSDKKVLPGFDEQNKGVILLCDKDIEVHTEVVKHGNNSDAEYRIDWFRYKADDGKENIMWFSRIPPRKGTSKPPHVHGVNPLNGMGIFEHYFKDAGEATIGEGENKQQMSNYEKVAPYNPHYIEAGEGGAVFFILIENVEGVPDEEIHQFFQAA